MKQLTLLERQFIQAHLTDDVRALVLRAHPNEVDIQAVAAQISARQKAREKLPTWYANEDVVFPPALSVEQASSEATARYKAALVSGEHLLDLTGGMGVDTWAFAQRVAHVTYVEQRSDLVELAAHNLPLLGATNVTVVLGDGLGAEVMPSARGADAQGWQGAGGEPVDWGYLDPHRRDGQGNKVVALTDYEPNVLAALSLLRQRCRNVLLKVSPMIDLKQVSRLLNPAQLHVVAVQGEVKEVLLVLHFTEPMPQPQYVAVDIRPDRTDAFAFSPADEPTADVVFADPQTYLYEPNAAVLKAGAYRSVGQRFGLAKLAPNTHLYTSDTLRSDFPGRAFVVQTVLKPDRKALQAVLPQLKANLTIRNYPQTVADLRKKLNLREGGNTYLFATTLLNGDKRLIVCRKPG